MDRRLLVGFDLTVYQLCLQPGEIWGGTCKEMVGRQQRKNTSSISLKCCGIEEKWVPQFCFLEIVCG